MEINPNALNMEEELKKLIILRRYIPQTSLENLVNVIMDCFCMEYIDGELDAYNFIELIEYIEASGGFERFDYYI